jgi:hypothetical protein
MDCSAAPLQNLSHMIPVIEAVGRSKGEDSFLEAGCHADVALEPRQDVNSRVPTIKTGRCGYARQDVALNAFMHVLSGRRGYYLLSFGQD